MIHIISGPQGAGKSTYARQLTLEKQGVCFSIDDYMIKLYGPEMIQPLDFSWVMERVARCHNLIWETSVNIVRNSGIAVLDLGLMKNEQRERFLQLAESAGVAIQQHFVDAPLEVRKERVMKRNQLRDQNFSFEVTPEMFLFMESQFEYPVLDNQN